MRHVERMSVDDKCATVLVRRREGKLEHEGDGHIWRYSPGINLLKPAGHVMHQRFNIQQLYALPTLCLCVLYLSDNKQRPVPLTA